MKLFKIFDSGFFNQAVLFLILVHIFSSCTQKGSVDVINIKLNSIEDINNLDSNLVKPYDYHPILSLGELSIQEKKEKFISLVLPSILIAKENIKHNQIKFRDLIKKDTTQLSYKNKKYIYNLLKKYRAKTFDELDLKLNTHPNSIILAQAIIESGWGSSRFFTEAYNIFGVWSFSNKEPRIKASFSRNGKNIYLKKYSSLYESIEDYFLTIARGPYMDFRKERAQNNNTNALLPYLVNYSELGDKYVMNLKSLIRKNHLKKYDNYRIDSEYLNH